MTLRVCRSTPGFVPSLLLLLVAAGSQPSCIIPANPSGGRAPSAKSMMRNEPPVPNVLVDQVGYLPRLPKLATVKTTAAAPVGWQLLDGRGKVVVSGNTTPFGPDRASGDAVHLVDFSTFVQPGAAFTLKVGPDVSHPFDIGAGVYRKLKYDALAFFYQNRSGIEIAEKLVGDKQWARPAGHLSDSSVPCAPRAGCSYKLDVSGGWYDAGDQGKYVVNGGIALWTLLAMYERFVHLGATAADFGDGKLSVPERGNGVPDLLDEARWELEWMLKMQVPAGQPLSGMAHHKIHDRSWTSLATRPDHDPEPRFLQRPSTAATFNLAATAAQGARIWKTIDPAFASRCLVAAERAWTAAMTLPPLFAPGGQTAGGGPYEDTDATDELYWAATELFITTRTDGYRAAMKGSPHYGVVPADLGKGGRPEQASAMTWQRTQALGTISLVMVPGALEDAERDLLRGHVRAAADVFVAAIASEGYRTPFKAGPKGYPWGSNSDVVNNLLVISLAADFSAPPQRARYIEAVAAGFGYLLGRNPLDKCYVSGYGERPLLNPHHRFWAKQYNYRFPPPPAGVLSGGPNSGLQDPLIRGAGFAGCAPQKCFIDHIESWSSNEVAINWNAPLAWVAAYLDEVGR